MKQLTIILLLLSVFASNAAERITATITATNETVNGDTIVVNGTTRTWTNAVYTPSTQILTNNTGSGVKSNLLSQIGLYPFSGVTPFDNGSNSMKLIGASGSILTVTAGTWAEISYTTQAVVSLKGVRVPISGEPDATAQRDIASLLVDGINNLSTNALLQSATVSSNLVGITNAQTITGVKGFTNTLSAWHGQVSNSPAISGNFNNVSNGVWWSGFMSGVAMTNGANYGEAFTSYGVTGGTSENFGYGALASAGGALAVGRLSVASGTSSLAVGAGAQSDGLASIAIGNLSYTPNANSIGVGIETEVLGTNSMALGRAATVASGVQNAVAIGYQATASYDNQIRIGTATEYVSIPGGLSVEGSTTNITAWGKSIFPAGSDISLGRYDITTLANGINDDIVIGTNVNIYVSGPSADFSIRGMAGGRDGKVVIIENDTGYNMTIAVEGGALGNGPTAGNRITSNTGADRATTGNGTAILKYNATTSRWKLISFDP